MAKKRRNNLLTIARRYDKINSKLVRRQSLVATKFSRIVKNLEREIKGMILEIFTRIRETEGSLIQAHLHIDAILLEIKAFINAYIKYEVQHSKGDLWLMSDKLAVRRAIASSVFYSASMAYQLSEQFVSKDEVTNILDSTKAVHQDIIAKRVSLFSDAYFLAIFDWVYTQIQVPIMRGEALNNVLAEVNDAFNKPVSPFRVVGWQPETRLSFIGSSETKLGFATSLVVLAAFFIKENPEEKLYAKSLAIHDAVTGQDSIEAEDLTEGWVGYPEPYFSITDFRRRPRDRCFDVIVTASDLEAEDIIPEINEETE